LAEFRPTTAAASAPLRDAERRARATLAAAEKRSRAFMAEAREMARRKLEEAFAAGREEGVKRGIAEGREAVRARAVEDAREELRRAAAVLVAAGERLARARDTVRAEAEAGIVRLAVAVGSKLAHRAIATDTAGAALASIREALVLAADRAESRTAREALREEFPEIVRIAVEQDASVPRGGCRVMTASCNVDATLEARAARIADILAGREAA